jgi:uncharacterized OsmC-like protein
MATSPHGCRLGLRRIESEMSAIEIELIDSTRCRARHEESGAELVTDVAPLQGGGGTSFSSTDLVGVGLATCIGSSIAPVAERESIPLDRIGISVAKTMAASPRRIEKLSVTVRLPSGLTDVQSRKLRNAAATCTVHRSLHGSIEIEVGFTEGDDR